MRIAVLGAGSIGRKHLGHLNELGHRDLIVYDTDRLKAVQASGDYDAALADDMGQVWDWEPAAVVICSPPATHMALMHDAFDHDCAVFCEKPLSDRPVLGYPADVALNGRRWVSHVASPLRWHEPLRRLRERFAAEPPVDAWFRWVYDPGANRPDWRQSYMGTTGALLDIGSHLVDLALWLLGTAKCRGCVTRPLLGGETDAYASLWLQHRAGTITTAGVAWNPSPPTRNARFHLRDDSHLEWQFDPAEHEQAYKREMQAFLDACHTGDTSELNSLPQAAKTLQLLLQARDWAIS